MKQRQKPRSYKSKYQQARILAKKLAGKSDSRIAKEETVTRGTVARILSQPEMRAIVDQHRQEILSLIPDSIQVLREELRKRGPEKVRVALEINHGMQVFVAKEERDVTTHAAEVVRHTTEDLIREAKEILANSGVEVPREFRLAVRKVKSFTGNGPSITQPTQRGAN